jgi:hypothetical protein
MSNLILVHLLGSVIATFTRSSEQTNDVFEMSERCTAPPITDGAQVKGVRGIAGTIGKGFTIYYAKPLQTV